MLRHLTLRYDVSVGTFADDPVALGELKVLRKMAQDLCISRVRRPWSYFSAGISWALGLPISFAVFRSRRLARWVQQTGRARHLDAIVTHSSNISDYALLAAKASGDRRPRLIFHFADVDSEKFAAYAITARWPLNWLYRLEHLRVKRAERRLATCADSVAFVSEEEAELFRTTHPGLNTPVTVLPNGVDLEVFDPCCPVESPYPPDQREVFVFTGAMDYSPNVSAVEWFALKIFPRVRNDLPAAWFYIVGSNPTAAVRALGQHKNVFVTGRVPSVVPYLRHACIAVAPLQIARGVQNKVLEAMAMAKPVIASAEALTGIGAISGEHVICPKDECDWIDACVRLARHPEQRERLGLAARVFVETKHSWGNHFAILDRLLAR
jgi:sugar transferase (PEP-CTERM/EpsH1 system associated)